jgi:hypothetical protein
MIDAQPSRWLEVLAGACLGAPSDDCRLGDLCEQYFQTHRHLLAQFGAMPGGSLAAGLLAHGRYLGAAGNVILFARVVEPVLRLAESNTMGLLALELRERLMNTFHFTVRKFALPALLLVCGALLVNSAYEGWTGARRTEALMASAQHGKAELAAQRIASFVDELQHQIGWVAYAQFGNLPVGQRRFDYVRLLRQVPAITVLTQLDGDGREQLVVDRLKMDIVDSGTDRSGEPAVVQAKTNKVFIGPLYYRKASEPYLTMAFRHGTRAGYTIAEVNLKLAWDTIAATKVDDGGYGYIVDGNGRLIAHPDFKFVLRQPDLKRQPQVEAALAGPSGRLVEGRSFYPEGPAKAVLSASAPVAGLDWKVIVDVPANAYEVPFRISLIRSVAMAGLGLVAMILAIALAIRPIVPTRPAQA